MDDIVYIRGLEGICSSDLDSVIYFAHYSTKQPDETISPALGNSPKSPAVKAIP